MHYYFSHCFWSLTVIFIKRYDEIYITSIKWPALYTPTSLMVIISFALLNFTFFPGKVL